MKVLILGASGHIGQHLLQHLRSSGWADVSAAARRVPAQATHGVCWLSLDSRDPSALQQALQDQDAVVNCVAGNASSIAQGAKALAEAALACKRPPLWVHLSSMAVYGHATGRVTETTPLDSRLGWYGRAKCAAEAHVQAYAAQGGPAVILRPGCVYGPGSELWVGRVGRWLHAHRLGDLGVAGDGFSNLVHVDDVCQAISALLRKPTLGAARSPDTGMASTHASSAFIAPASTAPPFTASAAIAPAFNLAAPDSPRWNRYFIDLALAIQATPVKRLGRQVVLDAWLAGPPLKLAQLLLARAPQTQRWPRHVPDPMPPGLLRVWRQHLLLDGIAAARELGLRYTPYAQGLATSADWWCQLKPGRAMPSTSSAKRAT